MVFRSLIIVITFAVMKTIILADNQDITRIGIEALIIASLPCLSIERASYSEQLKRLLRLYPDAVVILDYTLFDFESPSQMLNLKTSVPNSSWILFSGELSIGFLRNILLSDSLISILMKSDTGEEIQEALTVAFSGNRFTGKSVNRILEEENIQDEKREKLTASEKSILRQIAASKSTKEIAYEMNLSFHTVNTHRRNIFRKIKVNNVHEAIRYAVRSGIVDLADYYI